ncbi:MAG TPA: DNA translocase FtsK 4TM domain-containing protein, partial [Chryseolinea sp.]|nr:DNA translocase FtsK 4TM domain-containing protein [Chryseolinea sp.]
MAQNTYKSNTFKKPEKEKKGKSSSKFKFNIGFFKDPRFKLAAGFFLMIVGIYLFLALVSYLFTWRADESVVQAVSNSSLLEAGQEPENLLGLWGAVISHYVIFRWFGIAAFFIPPLLFVVGFKIVFGRELFRIFSFSIFSIFTGLWLSLLLGYVTMISEGTSEWSILGGGLGYHLAVLSDGMFGWGTFLILILSLFVFIIFYFNVTSIPLFVKDPKPIGNDAILPDDRTEHEDPLFSNYTDDEDNWP